MNMTEDMVNTINIMRFRNVPLADRGSQSNMSACHIYTKYDAGGNYYVIEKGVTLVARGPFLEFIGPSGSYVHVVYTAIESVIYPKEAV
jgi:hypothetical protein